MPSNYCEKNVIHNVYAFGSRSTKASLSLCWSCKVIFEVICYLFSLTRPLILGDSGQDSGGLLTTHHRYSGIWPHVEESGAVKEETKSAILLKFTELK